MRVLDRRGLAQTMVRKRSTLANVPRKVLSPQGGVGGAMKTVTVLDQHRMEVVEAKRMMDVDMLGRLKSFVSECGNVDDFQW